MAAVAVAAVLGSGAAVAETLTVAALGDSLTQGYGLVQGDGFVPQLQAWLDAHGADARVLNAGVSGDTTAGGRARVDWTLTPEVDAMIVALGGNDVLRGIDPAVSRANLDAILTAAEEAGVDVLLIGIAAPGNYGPAYKSAFDAMYPELAQAHGTLLVSDFLGAIQAAVEGGASAGTLMQADGIHPNAAGVGLVVARVGPEVLKLVARSR